MANPNFEGLHEYQTAPAISAASVTPDDVSNISTRPTRALWVGGGGNISVEFMDGTSATFTNVPNGTLLPFRVNRVNSTSTTASAIVALY